MRTATPGTHWKKEGEHERIRVRDRTKERSTDIHKPESFAKRARQVVKLGYTAIKFDLDVPNPLQIDPYNRSLSNAHLAYMEDVVAAVREAVGPNLDIAFDCHWHYDVNDVIKLADRIEKYNVMWLEGSDAVREHRRAEKSDGLHANPDMHRGELFQEVRVQRPHRKTSRGHRGARYFPRRWPDGGGKDRKHGRHVLHTRGEPQYLSGPIGTVAAGHS